MVVRHALGASRARIVAQIVTESLVLTIAAAVLGLAVAQTTVRYAWARASQLTGEGLPFWVDLRLEPVTVAYALALACVAAVLIGLLPALKATAASILRRLQGTTSAGGTMQFGGIWSFIVGAQVDGADAALDRGDVQPLVGGDEIDRASVAGRIGQTHFTEDFRLVVTTHRGIRSNLHIKACHCPVPVLPGWFFRSGPPVWSGPCSRSALVLVPVRPCLLAGLSGARRLFAASSSAVCRSVFVRSSYGSNMQQGFQCALKMHA